MWVTRPLLVPIEVIGDQQLLIINILQNILCSVQQNKEMYAGLEQLEGEKMTECAFLCDLSLLHKFFQLYL